MRNKQMIERLLFLLPLFLLTACWPDAQKEDKAVARVFDRILYASEVNAKVPNGLTLEDSTRLAEAYISRWMQQTVWLSQAEKHLPEEQKNVEQQLEDYRRSLIVYAYERELVRQKLDTIVSKEEVEEYYRENNNDFELKDYIVKVFYLKLEKNSPQLDKARSWFRSFTEESVFNLEDYAHQFAVNYFIDRDVWLYYDDLLKEIPIETYNTEQLISRKTAVEVEDEGYLYLIRFLDFRLKNSVSPLVLEQENIRNIILNQRKVELIKQRIDDNYEEALSQGYMERF